MSLPHALLTSLLEQSCAGSDLARRFDRSIGFFWQATHQQIYRELAKLEAAGWIESLPPESGRGRKRVYRVLEAGRAELQRWASESQDPRPLRNELMLRLRADAVIGPTRVREDIERRLHLHRDKLSTYRRIESEDFPAGAERSRSQRLQHLVLKAGILSEAAWVEWSEHALEAIGDDELKPEETTP